jgi:hypothetical protein
VRTVVHIGYHKTATKLLQTRVFPFLSRCTVVSPMTPSFAEFLPLVLYLCESDVYTDADRALLQDFVGRARRPDQSLLLSFEDFAARDYDGRTAARLAQAIDDAHILVCVREQRSLALSTYSQALRSRSRLSFRHWIEWLETHPAAFRYDELVARYQQLFGTDRVHVLAYEQLVADPRAFTSEVRELVDPGSSPTPAERDLPVVNPGLTRPARGAVLLANRVLVRSSLEARFRRAPDPAVVSTTIERVCARLLPRAPADLRTRDRELADRFAANFAVSNARLQHLTGLPLQDLGYVVADREPAPA